MPETTNNASTPPMPPGTPRPAASSAPRPTAPTPASAPVPPRPSASTSGPGALRVSLMPVDESEGKPDLRKRLVVLAIVLIAETLLIGGAYLFLAGRVESQARQLQVLEAERVALGREIIRQEVEAAELAGFAVQVAAITDRLDAQSRWSNAFDLLERLTHPDVRYESFAGNLAARTITMSASAPDFRVMAEQILALRADSHIENVRAEAGSASAPSAGSTGGVRWSMVITLTPELFRLPPAPTATSTAPAPAASDTAQDLFPAFPATDPANL